MQCSNHPEKSATSLCSECNKPLCDQCAASDGDGAVLCRNCAALKAAQDTVVGIEQRQREKAQKEKYREARKRKNTFFIRLASISFIGVVIVLNLFLFFRHSKLDWSEYTTAESHEIAIVVLDTAIQDYSKDHEGQFPERLDELIGTYVDAEEMALSDLEIFDYLRTSPHSYELRLINSDSEAAEPLVFTETGLK
jgi:hypothetical protein